MELDANQIIEYFSRYSIVLPLVAGIITATSSKLGRDLVPIFSLVLISMLSDELSIFFAKVYKNNMIVIHSYQFLESTLLVLFFRSVLKNRIINLIGLILIGYLIINPLLINSFERFDYFPFIVKSFFFIICCMIFYYQKYTSDKLIFLEKSSLFWIISGLLIYYSGAFFTFLTYDILKTWILHNLANTTKNLTIMIGFLVARKY